MSPFSLLLRNELNPSIQEYFRAAYWAIHSKTRTARDTFSKRRDEIELKLSSPERIIALGKWNAYLRNAR